MIPSHSQAGAGESGGEVCSEAQAPMLARRRVRMELRLEHGSWSGLFSDRVSFTVGYDQRGPSVSYLNWF